MFPQRRHFDTFDALRFLAFFYVFLQHIPISQHSPFAFLNHSGTTGVRFFFVLSGFLISYILLYEKQHYGTINIRNFFVRRILRIWPLFYAMILFAFVTPIALRFLNLPSSAHGYEPDWLLSCLFLENYNMIFSHSVPNVSPLVVMWSLCVEEHFYILWGLLFYFTPIRRVPILIGVAVCIGILSRVIYSQYGLAFLDLPTNIDFFAYGAIPAYCLLFKQDLIARIASFRHWVKYVAVLLAGVYSFASPNFSYVFQPFIDPVVLGLLFMTLLFFTLPQTNRIYVGSSDLLSRLGLYTYGLYLFHTIIINLLLRLRLFDSTFVLFVVALLVTIAVSVLSYHLFEAKFLSFKRYFAARSLSGFADSELKSDQ